MIRLRLAAVLLVVLCSTSARAEGQLDAIVTIWADEHFFGTGFFISEDGLILTAYHVIQGAHRITVLHQGTPSSNVLIESYAPNRDLAVLRVLDWKKPITYLKLAYRLPPGTGDESLMILGNGAHIEDQRIPARMITKDLRNSQEIRGDHGERVFNLDNVHVIYLDADTNDGLSGGPVVSSAGVIGVLSGSLRQGGSISWAIPSEYAQPQILVRVSERPEEISSWPSFDLMSEGRRNVRAAVAVSPEVADVIERYYVGVAKSATDAERIPTSAEKMLALAQVQRRIAEQGKAPEDSFVIQLAARQAVFERVENEWDQDGSSVVNCILELEMKIVALHESVPATQGNLEVFERFFAFMKDYEAKYHEKAASFLQRVTANFNRSTELMAEESGKKASPEFYLKASTELEDLYSIFTSPDFRIMTVSEAELWSELGSQIQLLMTARLESKEEDWKFSSERGFTIRFPAGWELVIYPPATSLLSESGLKELGEETSQAHKFGGDFDGMLQNKILTNDRGNLGMVSLKVFTRSNPGPVGPLSESERSIIEANFRQSGFREIDIEREMLNGHWSTVVRATYDDPAGNAWVAYDADIHGTDKIVSLQLFVAGTHASSVIPSFRRVLETVEFK